MGDISACHAVRLGDSRKKRRVREEGRDDPGGRTSDPQKDDSEKKKGKTTWERPGRGLSRGDWGEVQGGEEVCNTQRFIESLAKKERGVGGVREKNIPGRISRPLPATQNLPPADDCLRRNQERRIG